MTLDEGQTHYVGDGCQPAHDPRIDQTETKRAGPKIEQWSVVAPPTADNGNPWRVIDAAQKTVAIVPNSPREKRARLIASAPELLALVERLRAARVEQNDEYLALQQEYERLRAVAHAANGAFLAFAKAPPELADDHELTQAMSTLGAALDSYDTLRESS